MRTTFNVYRQLGKFMDQADADARARGEPYDKSLDAHFRSGVLLGVGISNIILSLLPRLPKDYKVVLLKNEFGDVEGKPICVQSFPTANLNLSYR